MKANELVFKSAVNTIINKKMLRHAVSSQLDKFIYNRVVVEKTTDLPLADIKMFQFLSAILKTARINLDKGNVSQDVLRKMIHVVVRGDLKIKRTQKIGDIQIKFKEKYKQYPPQFIVLSPTQVCNLNCLGCYASSDRTTNKSLTYNVVEKIMDDVYYLMGRKFVVISGGEPFMYKSEGKTLLNIFEKYNDIFFLIYTNGTLITHEIAAKLARLGNVTPAVSVEGFEKDTDNRRGKGVYKKILASFENLRQTGVPFGISVTATSKNLNILLSEKFYDYYFGELGASYMWQFQIMPIGRSKETFDLVVNPANRVKLYRVWEKLLSDKKYPVADFWNSGVLSGGCIAYGRWGGYLYIDWNGNIMPCVFVPYYVDNIMELYRRGKTLGDALLSDFMKNGQKWHKKYFAGHKNGLMPCSIRDHYDNFRKNILTESAKGEDKEAEEILHSSEYYEFMKKYDKELEQLTDKIWGNEYLKFEKKPIK